MPKADESASSLRLALTPAEAARALGCSRDFFDKHIGPELRWVRRGRPEVRRNRRGRRLVAPECCIHTRARVSAGSHNRDSAQRCCKVEGARHLCATRDVLVCVSHGMRPARLGIGRMAYRHRY
jgi:hypothetical protein